MIETYKKMLASLKEHKIPRELMLSQCIQLRLDKSLDSYMEDLSRSHEYLNRHATHRTIRRLNK